MHKWPQGSYNYATYCYAKIYDCQCSPRNQITILFNYIKLGHYLDGYTIKHRFNKSNKATNILTCNLNPLRGVVPVRARNGYRPRQVSASVFALLSNNKVYNSLSTQAK
jgi:hypothetical protein